MKDDAELLEYLKKAYYPDLTMEKLQKGDFGLELEVQGKVEDLKLVIAETKPNT